VIDSSDLLSVDFTHSFIFSIRFTVSRSFYPHGGAVSLGLIVSTIGAFLATIYSAMSCRFVVVTYLSERGNFDTLFTSQGGDEFKRMNTAAGLFQWLSPVDSWDTGTCIGYTQSALNVIADVDFETARVLAVLAVILGCFLMVWTLALACISLGQFQIWLFAACQLLLVVFVALFFLINQSNLCHNIEKDSFCRIDQGGMMAVAAATLWGIAFLLTVVYMRSLKKRREKLVEALAQELADKKRKEAVEKRKRREQNEQEQQAAGLAASFDEEALIVATAPNVKRSQAPTPETRSSVSASFDKAALVVATPPKVKRSQASTPETRSSVSASFDKTALAVATPPKVKRSQSSTPDTVSSVVEGQDGELEVYISGRLDKIGRILDEEESL
jgi:hypothetical protein